MLISDETISKVRDSNDIAEVIGEYVPNLKRAGKDFKGLCPFHNEKTPSFMISPSKGIFHCFGCGKGGDVFKFVMEMDKCSYPEAIRKLAERKAIPVQEGSSDKQHALQRDRRKVLLQILQRAAEFYHKTLLDSEEAGEARKYLVQKRGLTQETIQQFQLGYAPAVGQALLNVAKKSGFSEQDLVDAGIAVKSQKYGKCIDWFRKRIVFPILDMKGDVVGFGGRILESDKGYGDNPPPKYINSPDTMIFQKGKNLYGFFQGVKSIRDKKEIIVLEGYMDVIGCHQAGVENTVAPLGTALTMDQCLIIKRYADQVSLLFDSDAAGDSAALRGSELLLEYGLMPMIARLPNQLDADEYLQKHSVEDFEKLLRKSMNVIEFKLHTLWEKNKDASSIVKKGIFSQAVLPLLSKIESEVIQVEMLKLAANRLEISEEALMSEFNKMKNKSAAYRRKLNGMKEREVEDQPSANGKEKPAKKNSVFLSLEEELVCLMLRHREFLESFEKEIIEENCFSDVRLNECFEFIKKNLALDHHKIVHQMPPLMSEWVNELLSKQIESKKPAQEIFESHFKRFLQKKNEERMRIFGKKAAEGLNKGISDVDIQKYKDLVPTVKGSKKMKKSIGQLFGDGKLKWSH